MRLSFLQSFKKWFGNSKQQRKKQTTRQAAPRGGGKRRLNLEELESRETPAVGGGFTGSGMLGEYFNNTTLSGTPAFSRSDVRIDFDWGTTAAPGGSISSGFNSIGHNDFSVLWTGQVIPAFSETYTFSTTSAAGAMLLVRPTGTSAWTTLINDWTAHTATVDNGTYAMTAGSTYDIEMEYYQTTGAAVAEPRPGPVPARPRK